MIHKAVILAAGKGTRMRELTDEMPKPMLPVRGKPILEHIVTGMRDAGITDFCIITGWHAEKIETYFGDGMAFGVKISYIRQETQDGTGSSVALARDFADGEQFLMSYGDIMVEKPIYAGIVKRFSEGSFDGTVSVLGDTQLNKALGLFLFDADFVLAHLIEKPSDDEIAELHKEGWLKKGDTFWYNAGIFVFPPSIFKYLSRIKKSPRGEYELMDALTLAIRDKERYAGCMIKGSWADVRDPEILASLQ